MAKEKIVRCVVCKRGSGHSCSSVRYVPLEIFRLWKHLMTDRHGFDVADECLSLWFDIDGDPNITYAESNYEQVTRVSLRVYSESDAMFHEVTRYFPTNSYPAIRPLFLSHYEAASDEAASDEAAHSSRIQETRGVWLRREDQ